MISLPDAGLFQINAVIGDGPFGASSGDYDVFRFEGTAGFTYSFDIDAAQLGGASDLAFDILIDGTPEVGSGLDNADGTDPFHALTLAADATIAIIIRGAGSGPLGDTNDSGSGGGVSSTGGYRLFLNAFSAADDPHYFHGTANADTFNGGLGNDVFHGGWGNDGLAGGGGDDLFVWFAGDGNDSINGNSGTDVLSVTAAPDREIFVLNTSGSNALLTSNGGASELTVAQLEQLTLNGYGGNDIFMVGNLTAASGLTGPIEYIGGNGVDTIDARLAANAFDVCAFAGNDVVTTGSGNDTLRGGDGNDTLNAGAGIDTLVGGAGADRFVSSAPTSGADTVTDFSTEQGDKFVLDRAGFGLTETGAMSEVGIDFVHGSASRTAAATILVGSDVYFDADGTGPAASVLLAHIGTASQTLAATGDFNGDGTTDLLWKNVSDGTVETWLMDAEGGLDSQNTLPSNAGYDLAATGDFNGDGTDDLLWRNAAGQTESWLMSSDDAVAASLPSTLGYSLIAQGDFNGDDLTDLMWKHDTSGETIAWLMSATGNVATSAALSSTAGYGFLVMDDYNGDGNTDTMWKNVATGETIVWRMFADGQNKSDAALSSTAGYNLVASGDVNGDGNADAIWKETSTGDNVAWLMFAEAGKNKSDATLPNTLGYSQVVEGDLNGDGTIDVLWKHNITGETFAWLINAVPGEDKTDLALPNTLGYSAVATGDFDGNGTTDILWRHAASGNVIEWLMDKSAAGGVGFQATLPNTAGMSVLSTGDFNGDGTNDVIWERASDGAAEEWLTVAGGSGVAVHALASTGGTGVAHLTQDDFLVDGVSFVGGPDDDYFAISDAEFSSIAGNDGLDRIVLTPSFEGKPFNLTANAAKITSVEVISLDHASGAMFTLSDGDIAALNPTGNFLYVTGGSDDEVFFDSDDWSVVAANHVNTKVDPNATFVHWHNSVTGSDLYLSDLFAFTIATSTTAFDVI